MNPAAKQPVSPWWLRVLAGVVSAIIVGIFWAALDMRSEFAVMTEKVDSISASIKELSTEMKKDGDLLMHHLTDPTIHHTKLIELETRIQALEKHH